MALFNFGKKKEQEKKASSCCCGSASRKDTTNRCGSAGTVISIKVLGAGCKSCHEQFEHVQNAVNALGLGIETEYITDMEKVMSYGVMSMPAIVVNETVVSMGKVLKSADVIKLLKKLGYY